MSDEINIAKLNIHQYLRDNKITTSYDDTNDTLQSVNQVTCDIT
jgi:hypothetical protein